MFGEVDELIEKKKKNGDKYFVFDSTDDNKEVLTK